MAKMIYKNTTHALLYCRTIHQNSLSTSKIYEDVGNSNDKNNISNSAILNNAKICRKINKVHNKIMFKATEIISLTLNNPDEYFLGLKRVLLNKNEKYAYIFNGSINNNIIQKIASTIFNLGSTLYIQELPGTY
jgi:hypothetical protein